MSDHNDGPSIVGVVSAVIFLIIFGTAGILVVKSLAMIGTTNTAIDQQVVESSRQYAESNIGAFYLRLEAVTKINIQLMSTTLTPEMRAALTSQRDVLEFEMRRSVAKIPVGSRTSAMSPYSPT